MCLRARVCADAWFRVAEVDQLLAEPKLDFKKVRAFSFDHGTVARTTFFSDLHT